MNKVGINVLESTLDGALAARYGAEGLDACSMLRGGQLPCAGYAKPDGPCDEAPAPACAPVR